MKLFSVIVFLILFQSFSSAQENYQDPFSNRVVLKHYSIGELEEFKNNNYERFKSIKYLYIHSFIINETEANACPEFNIRLFDVSEYESQREEYVDVIVNEPKCGVSITLLSRKKLNRMIASDSVEILGKSEKINK